MMFSYRKFICFYFKLYIYYLCVYIYYLCLYNMFFYSYLLEQKNVLSFFLKFLKIYYWVINMYKFIFKILIGLNMLIK